MSDWQPPKGQGILSGAIARTMGGVEPPHNVTLSSSEQYELRAHEQVIERGLGTFVEVGNALLAIRDQRLYRSAYKTFEEYCRQRWSMTHQRADQLIAASEVMGNLTTTVVKPTNERQARELAKLADADQVLAWKTIVETAPGGKITAGHVEAVANTLREIRDTGVMDIGGEVMLSASDAIQARLTDETYERMQRQKEHIDESQKRKAHVANHNGEYEWYTPSTYIEAARRTMGSIDCDPATTAVANERVRAAAIYTLENSGLDFANKWAGNVWMNPPYATGIVDEFSLKLVSQFKDGITRQACVLVNNATETAWFQEMVAFASAVCLVRGRIKYLTPTGEPLNTPLQGQAVLYLGDNSVDFAREFAQVGRVLYGGS